MTNILGSINVNKIDKEKLFKGKKGNYLDIVLIPTPDSKYDQDYVIMQQTKKDEESIILGNGKIAQGKKKEAEDDSDLPF